MFLWTIGVDIFVAAFYIYLVITFTASLMIKAFIVYVKRRVAEKWAERHETVYIEEETDSIASFQVEV